MFCSVSIACRCGNVFSFEFPSKELDGPPVCSQCGAKMEQASWGELQRAMVISMDACKKAALCHTENDTRMSLLHINVSTGRR